MVVAVVAVRDDRCRRVELLVRERGRGSNRCVPTRRLGMSTMSFVTVCVMLALTFSRQEYIDPVVSNEKQRSTPSSGLA